MEKQREGAFIKPQKQAFAHQTDCHERTVALVAVQQYSEVSVGEIPWERRSHTRHYFLFHGVPRLQRALFRGNARFQPRKIVLSIIDELVNLNLVNITARWRSGMVPDLRSTSNPSRPAVECNPGQVVNTHVPLSPSSIIWYQPMGGDALRLGR